MKQRITTEQLNGLTESQKTKLRNWWKSRFTEKLDIFANDGLCYLATGKNLCDGHTFFINMEINLPLLDIGQMIEFLKSPLWMLKINESCEGYWHVELDDGDNNNKQYRPELCDALFEAVKGVL